MTEKRQVWAHGTSVQVEYPDKLESHARKGWGTRLLGKYQTKNWFHFSIPTVALTDNIAPILHSIYVLYDAKGFFLGGIQNVHIYDGPKRLFAFDDLAFPNYIGDHSETIDEFNCWDVSERKKRIFLGLGISVGVLFTQAGVEGGLSQITFTAAGAKFSYDQPGNRIIAPIS